MLCVNTEWIEEIGDVEQASLFCWQVFINKFLLRTGKLKTLLHTIKQAFMDRMNNICSKMLSC
ncbi:hypothetical protein C7B61_21815 [filamentous cyanobacterium CCP1]|nr:hypothetical protein C7B76_16580 [filamentous cyanobacterium CCP2]PSB54933.1 hypothetical protein C7B61_21815 [filamentous cyanobacterium CCP1]